MIDLTRIPSSWRSVPLSECTEIVSGSTPRREVAEYWGGTIPWATPKDLSDLECPILEDTPEYITERGFKSCSTQLLPQGAVLFSSRAPIGLVAVAGKPMCTNQGFKSFIPGSNVHGKYLYYCLKEMVPQIQSLGNGATFKEVSKAVIGEVRIPLPPRLEEQQRIAAILDKAHTIRKKREHVLTESSRLLQSAFVDLVGDTIHNVHDWKHVPLNDYLTFLTSGSRGWAEHYVKHGKRFIRSLDVQMNEISNEDACYVNPPEGTEAERTRVQDGDVLLTITGSKVGRVAFVPDGFGEAYVSQHVAILRLNTTIRPRFLSMFLSLPTAGQLQIKQSQYGQTKPGLSLEQIRGFLVPAVPTEVQDRFCAYWQRHDRLMGNGRSAMKQAAYLFNSLVQRAFRGELQQ